MMSSGVARDSAGSHHGKIVGATPSPGKAGKALEFKRKAGDRVEIPYAEDFGLSTFTVSAWVYLTQEPTFSGILGTRHGGDQTFDMKVNAAKVHGDIGDGSNWIEISRQLLRRRHWDQRPRGAICRSNAGITSPM
jgi:hypothetical protein